jgi:hypothetical protein
MLYAGIAHLRPRARAGGTRMLGSILYLVAKPIALAGMTWSRYGNCSVKPPAQWHVTRVTFKPPKDVQFHRLSSRS